MIIKEIFHPVKLASRLSAAWLFSICICMLSSASGFEVLNFVKEICPAVFWGSFTASFLAFTLLSGRFQNRR